MTTDLTPLIQARTLAPLWGREPCPVGMYLARLRGSGRRTMLQALTSVARRLLGSDAGVSHVPWYELRYEHLLAIRTRLHQNGLAPATINKHLTAIRGVLRQEWKLGKMSSEAYHRAKSIENVKGVRLPAGRMLAESELHRLVRAGHPRDLAVLGLCFGAGLRRSEAVAVDIVDLFPDRGVVRVRNGKGDKEREAFMGAAGFEWVVRWLEYRDARCEAVLTVYRGLDRLSANGLYDSLRSLCKRSGVKACSPHDLRRTFASRALDGGADLATVSKLMGHADPRTTARYDRRGDESLRSAAAGVEL